MLDGFTCERRTFSGKSRDVYYGGAGPGVLVISEIPGITPEVAGFARKVVERGVTVAMPELFGHAGRKASGGSIFGAVASVCVSREFSLLATDRRSPVTDWLRELARSLHEQCGGPGIGAVGMCLTGNFALALMLDAHTQAPVLSQPSLPFVLGRTRAASLGCSESDLAVIRRRAHEEGVPVLGLRFTGDPMCPKARFDTLRRELGTAFEAIEIDSSSGNAHGIAKMAHSVLAADFVDEEGHPTKAALERVLAFFTERLKP